MAERKAEKNILKETVDAITQAKADDVGPIYEELHTQEDLNMDQKVTVRSIAGWVTGFKRIETAGDVTIPPEGTVRLSRSEIIAQVQNGNCLFCGKDNRGSHATLYIEDAATRYEVDFDSDIEQYQQKIITKEKIQQLFREKSLKTFQTQLKDMVCTRAEKYYIIQMIKKLKINDYDKIRIVEKHTGFHI